MIPGRRSDPAMPELDHAAYGSTARRAPSDAAVGVRPSMSETTGPGPALAETMQPDVDLTRNAGTGDGEAIGERIIVTGRVLDGATPVPHAVIEIWQANAAGRYIHANDDHPAPLDPNFAGTGRCVTDDDGVYRFLTIRPGAYPWGNHPNAWRPAHIHLSVFGPSVATRLITQLYFPGDPLHELDPILGSVPAAARDRLVARYDHDITTEAWALGYRFDIVLRGAQATPFEPTGAGALA